MEVRITISHLIHGERSRRRWWRFGPAYEEIRRGYSVRLFSWWLFDAMDSHIYQQICAERSAVYSR